MVQGSFDDIFSHLSIGFAVDILLSLRVYNYV